MKTTQEQRDELRRMAERLADRTWYLDAIGTVISDEAPIEANGNDPNVADYISAANPATIVALLDDLAAMTERAEKAERERDDQVRVALATFAASLGCAPTSGDIFAAIDTLRTRLAEVERERDNAIVQMHGAGARADNAERRESHLRTRLATLEAAMPEDVVMEHVKEALRSLGRLDHRTVAWLTRLDAARKTKEVG